MYVHCMYVCNTQFDGSTKSTTSLTPLEKLLAGKHQKTNLRGVTRLKDKVDAHRFRKESGRGG